MNHVTAPDKTRLCVKDWATERPKFSFFRTFFDASSRAGAKGIKHILGR